MCRGAGEELFMLPRDEVNPCRTQHYFHMLTLDTSRLIFHRSFDILEKIPTELRVVRSSSLLVVLERE